MPVELLDFVIGPTPYSSRWIWVAVVLSAVVILWNGGVFVLTAPAVRNRVMKRRFSRTVGAIGIRYRKGDVAAEAAAAATRRELRSYLRAMTGVPADYLQVDAIATTEAGSAATLLAQLGDVQFNADSTLDVGTLIDAAGKLIRTWS